MGPIEKRLSANIDTFDVPETDAAWAIYDYARDSFFPGDDVEKALADLPTDADRCCYLLGRGDGYNSYYHC